MTSGPHAPETVEAALRDRLVAVADAITPSVDASVGTAELLQALALAVKESRDQSLGWLLSVAISGSFPRPGDVLELMRRLDLGEPGAALVAALVATVDPASRVVDPLRSLDLVTDEAVVDVDFCARHEHNTGIQRVVRETMPRWVHAERPLRLAAWTRDSAALRDLNEVELDRVLRWNDRRRPQGASEGEKASRILVPWRTDVVLAEVPSMAMCAPLAALAEFSGNRVSLIGYDAIPLVSAEGQRPEESERFAHYLSIVKHADRVLAISESAAEEFRGFVDAVAAQDVTGPDVVAVPLAVEVPEGARRTRVASDIPVILCVGSHEPRKNQAAVLAAGERLHAEGIDFELVFVGGGSRSATARFDERVARLRARGFKVSSHRGLADDDLWDLFARARATVFVSLHEGFGLPVAESLSLGVPVLTSSYGSLAEIAAGGGCVTVDPRDDEAICRELRRMLTDDELIERLRAEASALKPRTWEHYADALWSGLRRPGKGAA